MFDIAATAKVSQSTVSRVLSGHRGVSAEKRQAVLAAASALDYRPNTVAQGLARGRSFLVGVLTLDRVSPFFGSVVSGIERGLRGTSYTPLVVSVNGGNEGGQALDTLLRSRVDALLTVCAASQDPRLPEVAGEIPVAVIGPTVPGLEGLCISVANEAAAEQAVAHLVAQGHRRIAHLAGPKGHPHTDERRNGYLRALGAAGIEPDPKLIVQAGFDEAAGFLATQELFGRGKFTAVFACNDECAYGALLSFHRRGLTVPGDISVVGFDDQPHSAFTVPPLTTVRQPSLQMGQDAAEAMVGLLTGAGWSRPRFSAELVVRDSTGPARRR